MALIGIDLGTTFCAVATLDERERPVTVPNRDGDVLTPSAIFIVPDGSAVVGQAALDMQLEQPERVAALVKRRMGLPDIGHEVAGRHFRPETLSAVILKKLAQDAELALGPVEGCVITVPAYFDDTRRKATMDAGKIAGLNVLDIIDEPSAAALAYSVQANGALETGQTILVYDLGGGTFDVTLVKLGKKRFQVLAIEGDVRLGGKDWDDRLAGWAAERFQGAVPFRSSIGSAIGCNASRRCRACQAGSFQGRAGEHHRDPRRPSPHAADHADRVRIPHARPPHPHPSHLAAGPGPGRVVVVASGQGPHGRWQYAHAGHSAAS